jgi:parallel beta-helix repeat protein
MERFMIMVLLFEINRVKRAISFKVFLILCFCAHVYAASYYVSSAGDDNNDGSLASPWQTIDRGINGPDWNGLTAADTLYIRDGDYHESFIGMGTWISVSGSAGAPVVITAYNGETPVIYGGFYIEEQTYIHISHLTIIGPHDFPLNWVDMPDMVIDDPTVGWIDPSENWSTREGKVWQKFDSFMTLYDQMQNVDWTEGISINNSSYITVENCTISHHTIGIGMNNDSDQLLVEHNTVHHCRDGIWSWRDGGYTHSVSNSTIRHNNVRQHLDGGITAKYNAYNVVIEYNTSEYNGRQHYGIQADGSSDCTIRYNTGTGAGYYSETMEYPGSSGINVHTAGSGNVVDGNWISMQRDSSLYDGNGVIVDYTPDGVLIQNNIFYRNMGSGITSTHSGNNIIVNNTCVENGYQTPDARNGAGVRMSQSDDVDNIIINNIFAHNKSCGIYDEHLDQQAEIDYNLYLPLEGNPIAWVEWDGSVQYFSVAELQSATPFGDHSLESEQIDWVFQDADDQNFCLCAGSPAIDSGTATLAPTHDQEENSRPSFSGFDAGAYEYTGPSFVNLEMNAFLEGAYQVITGDMSNDLVTHSLLPHQSPYPEDPILLQTFPDDSACITDWCLLTLIDEFGQPEIKKSIFLKATGECMDEKGRSIMVLSNVSENNYDVLIDHRNHLSCRSIDVFSFSQRSVTSIDFTTPGIGQSLVLVAPDVYGLWCGDIDKDNLITSADYVEWYNAYINPLSGYFFPDITLDGDIDLQDFLIWQRNARQRIP